jgi:hypothetical protein
MNIYRFLQSILAIVILSPVQAHGEDSAIWARHSHSLLAAGLDAKGTATVLSPDKHAELRLHAGEFGLLVNGALIEDLSNLIGSVSLTEVLWSPDSSAFFVNASDGGEVGTWKSYVFLLSGEKVREVQVGSLIAGQSGLKTTCDYKNLGSLGWMDGHAKIMLMEQVPSSSECSNMNSIKGYVIDTEAGRVLEVLEMPAVEKRFQPYFGDRSRFLVEGH